MNKDEINKKREKAREAMISPEQKERKKKRQETLGEKKYQAMLAMEGYDRKRRREIREAEVKEVEAKKQMEVDKKRREVDALVAEKDAKEEAERQRELAKEETLEKRIKTAHQKEKLMEELKLNKKSGLSVVRTFSRDLAYATKEGALSMAQIALKEKKADEKEFKKNVWPRIAAIVLTILLIIGGALVVYYAFITQNKGSTVNLPEKIFSLIPAENETEITLAGKKRNSLIAEIGQKRNLISQNGTITNIFFSRMIGETKIFGSFSDLISILELSALEEVAKNTSGEMMYGVFHDGDNHPFLLINVANYENTVATLLADEIILPVNLAPFLGATERPASRFFVFTDRLIKNQDTRSVLDVNGDPIFIYSLLGRNTLLFTKNEKAFEEVVKRYQEEGNI